MDCDFLIIGAGIAGASAAFELAQRGSVIVLERENQPGYHSTGRSAALFTENYGNPVIRGLTIASREFLEHPPEGFAEHDLLTPRGTLFIARGDQTDRFEATLASASELVPEIEEIPVKQALHICPVLDEDYLARAMYEPNSRDMDVHAIHHGFLRAMRTREGRLVNNAEVTSVVRVKGGWGVETAAGYFEGRILVNAAGAWCDEIAALAGVGTVGLVPKRRTAFNFAPPDGADIAPWATVLDVDEEFYFKPDAGQMLGSPADETPVEPQDVQPEELDLALAIDRITRATTMEIPRIEHSWAGLRNFVPDKSPVVGPAPDNPEFIWCAGQGGYGIMTAPAIGRITAALACGEDIPPDIVSEGVTAEQLGLARLRPAEA